MHATPRYTRVALPICLALLLAACGGDGPTQPAIGEPGLHVVLGAGVTDTIDTQLSQALVVEVRDENGALARGTVVRFDAQPPSDTARNREPAIVVCSVGASNCYWNGFNLGPSFASDTTDSRGRANVTVRLGHVAGKAVVRLTVPEYALEDSATFTVTPGAVAHVRAPAPDTALDVGATATLRGRVVDRYENTRPEIPIVNAGPGSVIALDVNTALVTGEDIGTQSVFMRHGPLFDSTIVRVVPTGRLVVWTSSGTLRLVNTNGSSVRTLLTDVSSNGGAFPHFDPTRERVTLHGGATSSGGVPNRVIVMDTLGSQRREIESVIGFTVIIAVRQLADGTLLVVGRRATDPDGSGYSVWRVATDNSITFMATVPGLAYGYGIADISHDGTRIVYASPGQLRVFNISSGAITLLDSDARSPAWSLQDDRVVYLVPIPEPFQNEFDGAAVIINADGTGRRALGSAKFSPGLVWSPDAKYVVGRGTDTGGLRLIRISDGANVMLRFRIGAFAQDYWQPDWR